MSNRRSICSLTLAATILPAMILTGCQGTAPEDQALPEPMEVQTPVEVAAVVEAVLPEGQTIGEPMDIRTPVAFATVDANPSAYFDQTVLVKATVIGVCAKAGCWMQVEDQGKTAMVRWEEGCGGKYAFPMEMIGKQVLVQGSFYPMEISEEDAAHIEEESAEAIEIDREGYEFNASAVLLIGEKA